MEYLRISFELEEGEPHSKFTVFTCLGFRTYVVVGQGFKYYVEAEDADVLVLTETKVRSDWETFCCLDTGNDMLGQVNNEPVDPELTKRYPHRYWSIASKKGYCTSRSLQSPYLC